MAKQVEAFTQVNVSLPAALVAFIQRRAEIEDRTLGGTIRRIIAEEARRNGSPKERKA